MRLGKNDELEFDVTESVRQLGIKGAYFVLDFEPEKANLDKVSSLLGEATQQIRDNKPDLKEDQILTGFRDLHTAVGLSNRKHVSSPENLIELILAGRSLPSINPIVDVYNIVSLQTRLALGAHDTSKLEGAVTFRLTNGTEDFTPLGSPDKKAIGFGEYGYIDEGCNEVICRLETRQCEKTKVSGLAKTCFFIVEGNKNTEADYIKNAVAKFQTLLVECCGASQTEKIYWLT
ncbi:MAG TPA: phenylalanine--tRNA ligase beta subunit-related protein [Patescibacteria group bacterium]|jgi:DNA/RNA-binding domain of Phe-tRNA-synthetase-like protein|nr:phenylalanine--tRNA ligase beta subunit-related protein [Patescibacteria group bacterium]